MIIVLAKIFAKDDNAKNQIIEFSKYLIENSKLEEGNIDYNLVVDTSGDFLMFVEKWESVEILQKHMQTSHFIEFGENIANLVSDNPKIDVFDSKMLEF